MVTRNDIANTLREIGIKEGDTVLVHSSFKSLGEVDGGAETVILGFFDAIGEDGTLVLPTFTQKDFSRAYETWHIDKESDTGYLTNYFRKRRGSVRSDQATHSVAAAGRLAEWLTETHGHTSKRIGNMGDTPFAPDSPWEKMYKIGAKIVMLGVSTVYITFRHYAESLYVEELLKSIEGKDGYDSLKDRLNAFNKPGSWPHVCNVWATAEMEKTGKIQKAHCGPSLFTAVDSVEFVDFVLDCLRRREDGILWDAVSTWPEEWKKWLKEYDKLKT